MHQPGVVRLVQRVGRRRYRRQRGYLRTCAAIYLNLYIHG
jgi:hypothetical protein